MTLGNGEPLRRLGNPFRCLASCYLWINTNPAWWNISTLSYYFPCGSFPFAPNLSISLSSSSYELITLWCRVCLQVCHFSVLKEPMVASLHGIHNVMQCTCKGLVLAFALFVCIVVISKKKSRGKPNTPHLVYIWNLLNGWFGKTTRNY